ncbi:hypothetical protein TIFTF001_020929 [Ficus carica]|uniref:Uncharacterized protein n=1 Tax=Ficus carica TaxID=3494 RepID=A0AA88A9J5_FICCA|nr:hypothetical protein TIFTF001_020929 [Ficus carica]
MGGRLLRGGDFAIPEQRKLARLGANVGVFGCEGPRSGKAWVSLGVR